jgi:hypothetical protein
MSKHVLLVAQALLIAVTLGAQTDASQWLDYSDGSNRFHFSYPQSFGSPSPGTNAGFGRRAAALRFSRLSGARGSSGFVLGGEAVISKGRVLVDLQALGGLYDDITLEALTAPLRDRLVLRLPELTSANFCEELGKERHLDPAVPELLSLAPGLQAAVLKLDSMRNGSPTILRCDVTGQSVAFLKTVTVSAGSVAARQHVWGAIQFLSGPFSSFQIVLRTADAPAAADLENMLRVVRSFGYGAN